jgi:hypothetical protein
MILHSNTCEVISRIRCVQDWGGSTAPGASCIMKCNTYASAYRRLRTTASRRAFTHRHCLVLADQRPIVRSEPVIALETAEFDSDGLADVRQPGKADPKLPDTTGRYRAAKMTTPAGPQPEGRSTWWAAGRPCGVGLTGNPDCLRVVARRDWPRVLRPAWVIGLRNPSRTSAKPHPSC